MFGFRKVARQKKDETVAQRVAAQAESLFRAEKMHCAEAVLSAVRMQFAPEVDQDIVRLAAGFGGGSGAGCICGAVSGATMAFGLAMNGDSKAVAAMTQDLHAWFKQRYRVTCCKVISAKGKSGCAELTAGVAGKVAELLQERGR